MSAFVLGFLSRLDLALLHLCGFSLSLTFLFLLLTVVLARRVEPAQRIVKAELVNYPQDEGPIRQETPQRSQICSLQ